MPLNDQMQEILHQLGGFGMPPLPTLSPENARQLPTPKDAVMDVIAGHVGARMKSLATPVPEPVGKISHQVIPGPGGDILLRVYTPKDGAAPFPVLVYFHGGGWVIGNLDAYDDSCRALCNTANCVVCSVAYRLAPEHKYPAGVEDAYAAYRWVRANAAALDGDPNRVAIAGESAGGNLAAVVCLLARDRGEPLPVFQLLVYPVCNNVFDTPSYRENANASPLSRDMMVWFFNHYLPSPAHGQEPTVSPLRAQNLSGLPPAMLITAEIDPLHSEGEAYAWRLHEAGVPVTYKNFAGVTHEFFGMKAVLSESKQAISDAANALQMGFSGQARLRPQQAQQPATAPSSAAKPGTPTAGAPRLTPDVPPTDQAVMGTPSSAQPSAGVGQPTSPTASQPNGPGGVQVGMLVVGRGGDPIGTIKAVHEWDILVDRPMQRDITIPKDALNVTGEQVLLIMTVEQIDPMNWDQPQGFGD